MTTAGDKHLEAASRVALELVTGNAICLCIGFIKNCHDSNKTSYFVPQRDEMHWLDTAGTNLTLKLLVFYPRHSGCVAGAC